MAAEKILLVLASTIPAALGAWATATVFLALFRVRDVTLRAAFWTWAAATTALAVTGIPATSVLEFSVRAPADTPLFRGGVFAEAMLAAWALGAAVLVAKRSVRDARLLAAVEGVAATTEAPEDLCEAVERTAKWMGVRAPRLAACDTGGTAFVVGVRSPVLFVPLGLLRRLDPPGRRAMLLHELAHIRRRDPLRLRVLSYLVDALWPAFALRWTAARLREAWESQADEESVHGGATRSALARSLVEAWSAPSPAGVLAFGGSGGSTARRLSALGRRTRVVGLALQVLALAYFVPWCPGWEGTGTSLRVVPPGGRGKTGLVRIALGGGGNPFSTPVERPMVEGWTAEVRASESAAGR